MEGMHLDNDFLCSQIPRCDEIPRTEYGVYGLETPFRLTTVVWLLVLETSTDADRHYTGEITQAIYLRQLFLIFTISAVLSKHRLGLSYLALKARSGV